METSSACLFGYRWAYVFITTGTVSPKRLATSRAEYPSSIQREAWLCPYSIITTNRKSPVYQGLIVIRYYLALRGAENGVTAMVTPFFCVQG